MVQKIIKVGNSFAVTIPKNLLQSMGVAEEGLVRVEKAQKKGRVILDFVTEKEMVEEVVDPEVYSVAKSLLARYLPAFKELAKK